MKYDVIRTKRFRKELKKMLKRGADLDKLEAVVSILASGEKLPPQCLCPLPNGPPPFAASA